jgi:hypothetical protein
MRIRFGGFYRLSQCFPLTIPRPLASKGMAQRVPFQREDHANPSLLAGVYEPI